LKKGKNYPYKDMTSLQSNGVILLDVYILSTVHGNRIVDAPASKGTHEKTKLLSVMEYNTRLVQTRQTSCWITTNFRESLKWWNNCSSISLTFSHKFKHSALKNGKEYFRLHKCMDIVAEGLVSE
jgi:hypothetical protein